MRPDKAVVIVYESEEYCKAHDEIIAKGICGRLVLRNPLRDSITNQSAEYWIENTDNPSSSPADPCELISSTPSKLIYIFLSTPTHITSILAQCEHSNYFISLILHTLHPVPHTESPLAPKQSYMFDKGELIQQPFLGSVFYVDYEKNYTRRDWLQSVSDRHEIGGNRLILLENHHKELLTRLGLNSKYGS